MPETRVNIGTRRGLLHAASSSLTTEGIRAGIDMFSRGLDSSHCCLLSSVTQVLDAEPTKTLATAPTDDHGAMFSRKVHCDEKSSSSAVEVMNDRVIINRPQSIRYMASGSENLGTFLLKSMKQITKFLFHKVYFRQSK